MPPDFSSNRKDQTWPGSDDGTVLGRRSRYPKHKVRVDGTLHVGQDNVEHNVATNQVFIDHFPSYNSHTVRSIKPSRHSKGSVPLHLITLVLTFEVVLFVYVCVSVCWVLRVIPQRIRPRKNLHIIRLNFTLYSCTEPDGGPLQRLRGPDVNQHEGGHVDITDGATESRDGVAGRGRGRSVTRWKNYNIQKL